MDDVQQVCHFNNTPSSQTFKIYQNIITSSTTTTIIIFTTVKTSNLTIKFFVIYAPKAYKNFP
jgi:hypothetical protein